MPDNMTEADDIEAMARAYCIASGYNPDSIHEGQKMWEYEIDGQRAAFSVLKSRGWQRVPEGSVVVPKTITASQVDELDIDTHMTVYNEVSHGNHETMLGLVPDKVIADFYNTMTAMLDESEKKP